MALKALICLLGPHGSALELYELADEVLDEMGRLIKISLEWKRSCPSWVLRAAGVEVGDDRIAAEGFVGRSD